MLCGKNSLRSLCLCIAFACLVSQNHAMHSLSGDGLRRRQPPILGGSPSFAASAFTRPRRLESQDARAYIFAPYLGTPIRELSKAPQSPTAPEEKKRTDASNDGSADSSSAATGPAVQPLKPVAQEKVDMVPVDAPVETPGEPAAAELRRSLHESSVPFKQVAEASPGNTAAVEQVTETPTEEPKVSEQERETLVEAAVIPPEPHVETEIAADEPADDTASSEGSAGGISFTELPTDEFIEKFQPGWFESPRPDSSDARLVSPLVRSSRADRLEIQKRASLVAFASLVPTTRATKWTVQGHDLALYKEQSFTILVVEASPDDTFAPAPSAVRKAQFAEIAPLLKHNSYRTAANILPFEAIPIDANAPAQFFKDVSLPRLVQEITGLAGGHSLHIVAFPRATKSSKSRRSAIRLAGVLALEMLRIGVPQPYLMEVTDGATGRDHADWITEPFHAPGRSKDLVHATIPVESFRGIPVLVLPGAITSTSHPITVNIYNLAHVTDRVYRIQSRDLSKILGKGARPSDEDIQALSDKWVDVAARLHGNFLTQVPLNPVAVFEELVDSVARKKSSLSAKVDLDPNAWFLRRATVQSTLDHYLRSAKVEQVKLKQTKEVAGVAEAEEIAGAEADKVEAKVLAQEPAAAPPPAKALTAKSGSWLPSLPSLPSFRRADKAAAGSASSKELDPSPVPLPEDEII